MVLNQDFREFIQLLNKNKVRYLVIGGYAVAFHGHPRYTKDIDFWIGPSEVNTKKLIKALYEFGFGSLDLRAEDFQEPNTIVQLGYPPNRIDLITSPKDIDFKVCWKNRIKIEVKGTTINFIDLENLKKNKRATGRYQDLADLENLMAS